MTTSLSVGRFQGCPPKENILRIWKAAETRSQMRQGLEFVEYIWLRRLCHHFQLLGLDQENSPSTNLVADDMEEFRNVTLDAEESDGEDNIVTEQGLGSKSKRSPLRYMSVFSFLDAIRLHKSVAEIEKHRKGPTETLKKSEPLDAKMLNSESSKDATSSNSTPSKPVDATDNVKCDSPDEDASSEPSQPVPSTSSASDTQKFFQNFNLNSKPPYRYSQQTRNNRSMAEYTYTYSYSDALKYAIMYGHVEYTIYLLETHLEAALLETICCPLLLVAVRLGHPDIVEQLCSHSRRKPFHNYYINKSGCSAMEAGRTALHVAAEMGNVTMLRLLLKYGADSRVTDDHGQTPMCRVLYRLQAPHITNRTVRCIYELLKCQTSITAGELAAISRIVLESAPTVTERDKPIVAQMMGLEPGPLALKHLCRVAIRRRLTYPYLPEGLQDISLPNSLVKYLKLQD